MLNPKSNISITTIKKNIFFIYVNIDLKNKKKISAIYIVHICWIYWILKSTQSSKPIKDRKVKEMKHLL